MKQKIKIFLEIDGELIETEKELKIIIPPFARMDGKSSYWAID